MTKNRSLVQTAFLSLLLWSFAPAASAVPFLQLDIEGGYYDTTTETIVTDASAFTLYAYATPLQPMQTLDVFTADYFVSIALTPQTGPADQDLGSFSVNGAVYSATSDMIFGVPPVEMDGTAAFDGGDLPPHGVFPTFFVEVPISFSMMNVSGIYNTAEAPGSGPIAGTGMFYAALEIDRANLSSDVELAIDLYSTRTRSNGDIDVRHFAPFSHNAGTVPAIPEPSAALVFAVGLLAVKAGIRRR